MVPRHPNADPHTARNDPYEATSAEEQTNELKEVVVPTALDEHQPSDNK
jgi:hypothetical protein